MPNNVMLNLFQHLLFRHLFPQKTALFIRQSNNYCKNDTNDFAGIGVSLYLFAIQYDAVTQNERDNLIVVKKEAAPLKKKAHRASVQKPVPVAPVLSH